MYPHLNPEIPVVCISNTAESFCKYVGREIQADKRADLMREMQGLGDRALLFPISSKLVFMSYPVHHELFIREVYGFYETMYLTPRSPSPSLCLDILRERRLLNAIVQYSTPGQTLYLIPHATTRQFLDLVEILRNEYQLEILLPESPDVTCLWLRDYIDTKCGFRSLVGNWLVGNWLNKLTCKLPLGIACRNLEQAVATVHWFLMNGKSCIAKADQGNDALGQTIIRGDSCIGRREVSEVLRKNHFLQDDLILVEEFIDSPDSLFPSLELFVPPQEEGIPEITYPCNQIFSKTGRFVGLLIEQHLKQQNWYPTFERVALHLAMKLQSMGYVGHFDLDAIIDAQGTIFLLEINARRTGGTHVHEVARYLLGNCYDNTTLLSNTAISSKSIRDFQSLSTVLREMLFPVNNQPTGIMITHTSMLSRGMFGYIIFAPSQGSALSLQRQMNLKISDAKLRG